MKIFLSWSGSVSNAIAKALHRWLPRVIPSARPWMSAADIFGGVRWSPEIAREMETTPVGIICVTIENMNDPWLLFEADMLSKTPGSTLVCPYLFDMEPDELTGPLARFQGVKAEEEDTKRLIRTINLATGERLLTEEVRFESALIRWWPLLERKLKRHAVSLTAPNQPVLAVPWTAPSRTGRMGRNIRSTRHKRTFDRTSSGNLGQLTEEARQKSLMRKRVSEMPATYSEVDRILLNAVLIDKRSQDDVVRKFAVSREYLRALLHHALRLFRERYGTVNDADFRTTEK